MVTFSNCRRMRVISSTEPNVAVKLASAPDFISSEAEMVSSTSIGLTRVATRPKTRAMSPMR
ncbi:hypothetical protein D3C73_1486740 [compost metagenome]